MEKTLAGTKPLAYFPETLRKRKKLDNIGYLCE
jgi:hypothetical protein